LNYWKINRQLLDVARQFHPQIVIVAKGMWISPETIEELKTEIGCYLINYATDDPFNAAVSRPDLIRSIPFYDLFVSTKRAIMEEIQRAGCSNVAFVPFAYEPRLHFPEQPSTGEEVRRFLSDVGFVGGADHDRVLMMRKLIAGPWQVNLYGGFWNRDWTLRKYYCGFAIGREYRLAVRGAKINLGLVRHANRDGHAMRTFEIPACGAFMLAERTEEHMELFVENKEAVFFGSNDELWEKINYYLVHDAERQRIAQAGYERVRSGKHSYRDRVEQILDLAQALL
jgi:spore maturation protein CgeB